MDSHSVSLLEGSRSLCGSISPGCPYQTSHVHPIHAVSSCGSAVEKVAGFLKISAASSSHYVAHYPGFDIGQLKGQDRYYLADDILHATSVWWPYTIIVSRKPTSTIGAAHISTFQLNRMARGKAIPNAAGR